MENSEQQLSQFRVYTSVSTIPYLTKVENISSDRVKLKTNHPPLVGETVTFEVIGHDYSSQYMGNGTVTSVDDVLPGKEGSFELSFENIMPADFVSKILH